MPVGLETKVHVDLVVVGSVAVSEKGEQLRPSEPDAAERWLPHWIRRETGM